MVEGHLIDGQPVIPESVRREPASNILKLGRFKQHRVAPGLQPLWSPATYQVTTGPGWR